MKTNMTHDILLSIAQAATIYRLGTDMRCYRNEWSLRLKRKDKNSTLTHYFTIDRDTKIGDIEEWMKES